MSERPSEMIDITKVTDYAVLVDQAYEHLPHMSPREKVDLILRLIELHPDHHLELPALNGVGANLDGIDLDQQVLVQRLPPDRHQPPWWRLDVLGAQLSHADLRGVSLRDAHLRVATLEHANLDQADLRGTDLEDAQLRGAALRRTQLQSAHLIKADLTEVDLREARLQQTDLRGARLERVQIAELEVDKTRLDYHQFVGGIAEEELRRYRAARQAYVALKLNFQSIGDYWGASWAYLKERQMDKEMHAPWRARAYFGEEDLGDRLQPATVHVSPPGEEAVVQSARPAGHPNLPWWHPRVIAMYAQHGSTWVMDWLIEICFGYGESIGRTFGTFIAMTVLFGGLYWALGAVVKEDNTPITVTDYVIVTLGALTNAIPHPLALRPGPVGLLLVLQMLLAIFLTGLLGFILGNRFRRI